MKKLIAYFTIISIVVIVTVRCTDLEEKVYSQMPMDSYGKTASEVNSLIAPIYTGLRSANLPINVYENTSDMSITPTRKGGDWWDGGQYKENRLAKWTPVTNNVRGWYNTCFARITNCNQILYMIENSPGITDKDPYLYQVRAARAYWYYHLIDSYGNVPIVTDFTDLSKPATKTRKEVYEFILSELLAIKDVIRSDVSASSYGKFTKGAVYTLLAKMYLNAMVWNPDGGPKWQECIDACNVVIGLPYSLEPKWNEQFAASNEGSKEAILVAVNSLTATMGIRNYTLHYLDNIALGLPGRGNNGISGMPGFVSSYDPDDKRLAWSYLIGPSINPATGQVIITAHGRPLIHTIDINMTYSVDADGWGQVEQEQGARCFKWEYKKGSTGMENDCALFRLADVYLMKAECLVRLGTDNTEATRLVNELRKRAFSDPAKLRTTVTLDDIYNERRWELAWESTGRQDQIRFGTFTAAIPGWRAAIPDFRKIFPIPQTAIDANPSLIQNPGY